MSKIGCKFQNSWLLRTDENGRELSLYIEPGKSNFEVNCKCCKSIININYAGYGAIKHHIDSKKHKTFYNTMFDANQQRLYFQAPTCSGSVSASASNSMNMFSPRDDTTKAELLLLMKKISNNESLSSCYNLASVLLAAFPDSAIVEHFKLERSKAAYLITDAIGPYFRDMLLNDIDPNLFYNLSYDETTNDAKQKELQISIRYFSNALQRVESHHLQTYYLSSGTGQIIANKLENAIDNAHLPLTKLLTLGMDGPNVNKNVSKRINESLKILRKKGLLDIGSCNLHTIHNTFRKGLNMKGNDISDLITQSYNYFDGFPSRTDDFKNFCKDKKFQFKLIIKHVPSRWLTLGPAAQRFSDIFTSLKSYFLDYLPKQKLFKSSKHYRNISSYLKQEDIELELILVIESSRIYERFLNIFQKNEPMIHLVYSEMNAILKTIESKICIGFNKTCDSMFEKSNLKKHDDIILSNTLDECLKRLKFNQLKRNLFIECYKNHFIETGKYLMLKISNLSFLENFEILDPKKCYNSKCISMLKNILKEYPINDTSTSDLILDEYRLFQLKEINLSDIDFTYSRIDEFWAKCSKMFDFPNLWNFVKSILTISHGQGDVERRFSISGNILTHEKSRMTERTLNSRLNAIDGINKFSGKVEMVPITKKFINMAHSANSNYRIYLEAEKEKRLNAKKEEANNIELEKKRIEAIGKIEELEKKCNKYEEEIIEHESNIKKNQKVTDALLVEANVKLNSCISKEDLVGAKVAQALYTSAMEKRKAEQKEIDEINKLKRKRLEVLQAVNEKRKKN